MEIAIENDLKFSARREKWTMALRSRLITELNNLFSIMNDMSSDDNLSNEDVNHSIFLMLAQSNSVGLWGLISDLTLQLWDADCIMEEIREVMLLILTHLYLYRRVCVGVYPSKRIHVAISGPIGTKFGTHMQIHLEKVVGKLKICPV